MKGEDLHEKSPLRAKCDTTPAPPGAVPDQMGRGFKIHSKGFLCLSDANVANTELGKDLTVLVVHELFVLGADACFELFLEKDQIKKKQQVSGDNIYDRLAVARHSLFGCY